MGKLKLHRNSNSIKHVFLILLTMFLTFTLLLFLLLFDNTSMDITNINVDNSISDIYNEILFNASSNNGSFKLNFSEDNINNILYLINRINNLDGDENFLEIKEDTYTFKIKNFDITNSKTIIETTLKIENNNLEFNINKVRLSNLILPSFISNKLLTTYINENLIKSFNSLGLSIQLDLNNKKIIYPISFLINDFKNIIENQYYNNKVLELLIEIINLNNNINVKNEISIDIDSIGLIESINDIISFDLETLIKENRNYFIKNNSLNYEKLYYVYTYFIYGYNYIKNKYENYDPYYILLKEEIDKINFKNTKTVNNIDPREYKTGYIKNILDNEEEIYINNLEDPTTLLEMESKGEKIFPLIEISIESLNSYINSFDIFRYPLIISSYLDSTYKIKIISVDSILFSNDNGFYLTINLNLNNKIVSIKIPIEKINEDKYKSSFIFKIEESSINDKKTSLSTSFMNILFKIITLNSNYLYISKGDDNYFLNINIESLTKGNETRNKWFKYFTRNKSIESLNLSFRLLNNNIQFITDNN